MLFYIMTCVYGTADSESCAICFMIRVIVCDKMCTVKAPLWSYSTISCHSDSFTSEPYFYSRLFKVKFKFIFRFFKVNLITTVHVSYNCKGELVQLIK